MTPTASRISTIIKALTIRRSASEWKDLAVEARWIIAPSKTTEVITSWPLDPQRLENVSIRWPSKYQWPFDSYVEPILHGFRKFVKTKITEIPQPYKGTVLFQFLEGQRSYDIALDCSDYLDYINEDAAKACRLYFKLQYDRKGYSSNHIVPGGFVHGNNFLLYKFLPRLRAIRDTKSFSYDVYGRFTNWGSGVRRKAVQMLSEQKRFNYEGGLETRRYSRFLRDVAQSKICINLPGIGDFCPRLIDYLAVGACVISPRLRTDLHVPLVDREHIVYTKDDLSDLVDLCVFYLEHDEEREDLCRQGRSVFDKSLHGSQLAAYYLHCCLNRLN